MLRESFLSGVFLILFGGTFINGPSGPQAAPLRYQFKDNPAPIYEVVIRAETPDAIETESGHIFYAIKSVDPDNGQITLGYTSQFQTSKQGNNGISPPRPPMAPPMFPFPAPQAAPDIMIDQLGKVLRTNRGGEDQHLPYILGLTWQLLLQPLPPDNQQTWKNEQTISLFSKKTPSDRAPGPPWQKQPEERIDRSAQETITYTIGSVTGDQTTIKRQIDLATDEKVGDAPVDKLTGAGQFVFDTKAGLIQSLEFKQTLEINQNNITVRVPVTVTARLLSPDEVTKLKADQDAAKARQAVAATKAQESFQKQQAQAAEDAKKLFPTAQQAAAQLKQIDAGWQPTTSKAVELLATMEGECTRDPDGTVILKNGQRIATPITYQVPTTFRIAALTQVNDIRFSYAADQIIFNWEMNHDELRIDGGPANGQRKAGVGRLPSNEWVGIEWVVQPDEMVIYVNGKEIDRTKADFSKINKPLAIEAHNGMLWIKSVTVVR